METELIDNLKALGAPDDIIDRGVIVYELRWPGTNEVYVGSTAKTLEERFRKHQINPYKCYAHLGIERATPHTICHYLPMDRHDREPERQYKDVQRARGYVVLDDGDRHAAPLWCTDQAKQKISEAKRGKKRSDETKKKHRKTRGQHFRVIWPDGRMKEYWSTPHAAEDPDIGVSCKTVDRYLKGISTPATGQRWKKTAHLKGCRFEYV